MPKLNRWPKLRRIRYALNHILNEDIRCIVDFNPSIESNPEALNSILERITLGEFKDMGDDDIQKQYKDIRFKHKHTTKSVHTAHIYVYPREEGIDNVEDLAKFTISLSHNLKLKPDRIILPKTGFGRLYIGKLEFNETWAYETFRLTGNLSFGREINTNDVDYANLFYGKREQKAKEIPIDLKLTRVYHRYIIVYALPDKILTKQFRDNERPHDVNGHFVTNPFRREDRLEQLLDEQRN